MQSYKCVCYDAETKSAILDALERAEFEFGRELPLPSGSRGLCAINDTLLNNVNFVQLEFSREADRRYRDYKLTDASAGRCGMYSTF